MNREGSAVGSPRSSSANGRFRAAATAVKMPTRIRYHSEEKKRREQQGGRSLAARGDRRSGTSGVKAVLPKVSADYRRFTYISVALIILLLGIVSITSTSWSKSNLGFRASNASTAIERFTEVGLFKVCNCTSFAATSNCGKRVSMARGIQATGIIGLLFGVAGFLVFLASTYISLRKEFEFAAVGCWGFCGVFLLCSWAIAVAYRNNRQCDNFQPLAAQGVAFDWAFGVRIVESIFALAATALLAVRAKGKLIPWPLAASLQTVVLCLAVTTSVTNQWYRTDTGYQGGPWGDCFCANPVIYCSTMAPNFRAAQAFGIIQPLLHVIQLFAAITVPTILPQIPQVAVIIYTWVVWLIVLLTWTLALSIFADCRCGNGVHQRLSWPFPVEFIVFICQTFVAFFVTYQYAKKRLLSWAARVQRRAEENQPEPSGFFAGDFWIDDEVAKESGELPAEPYGNDDGEAAVNGSPSREFAGAEKPTARYESPVRRQLPDNPASPGGSTKQLMAPTAFMPRSKTKAAPSDVASKPTTGSTGGAVPPTARTYGAGYNRFGAPAPVDPYRPVRYGSPNPRNPNDPVS